MLFGQVGLDMRLKLLNGDIYSQNIFNLKTSDAKPLMCNLSFPQQLAVSTVEHTREALNIRVLI